MSVIIQKVFGEAKVGNRHRCVPRRAIGLCTPCGFSMEFSADGLENFRLDDWRRLR